MTTPTTDRHKLAAMLAPLGIEPRKAEYDERGRLILLNLQDTHLKALPKTIGQFSQLQTLDLRFTPITELPAEIGQLGNLQKLDLGRTKKISQLPPEIGQLVSLQELDLHGTDVSQLPPKIGQLSSLQILDLIDTNISQLPPEIGQLGNLQELYLSRTHITQLPAALGQLASLHTLGLGGTNITHLPPAVRLLPNLRTLNLSHTSINHLSPEFSQLASLQTLELGGTSLSDVPHKLRDRCHWYGIRLPLDFFPISAWTAQWILDESNLEARHLMLERYGEMRFIEELGMRPHHQDDHGTLYRAEMADDEPLVMVRIKDASTGREYFLRIPPEMQTAQQAVAWTLGMAADEYRPIRGT